MAQFVRAFQTVMDARRSEIVAKGHIGPPANSRSSCLGCSLVIALLALGVAVAGYVGSRRGNWGSIPGLTAAQADVRFCGSNTIGAALAPALAEGFLQARGGTAIRREVENGSVRVSGQLPKDAKRFVVEVQGAGTATAFEALVAGNCDVAMASRQVLPSEVATLGPSLMEQVLGLDGIAVIVHPSNRVSQLDTTQLSDLFTGSARDWATVDGATGPVQVVGHDDQSGTYDTFRGLVLSGRSLVDGAQRFAGSGDVVNAVALSASAIGFTSFSASRGAKTLAIGEPGAAPIAPTIWTIGRESYPLTRRLYLYTHSQHTRPAADPLVAFALSPAGQAIVARSGFVDLSLKPESTSSCVGCAKAYLDATQGAKRLSADFRFHSGSAGLDSRAARDADRMAEYVKSSPNARLKLLGFADNRGAALVNDRLSLERADAVKAELLRRGITAITCYAMGSLMPVASNDTEDGRLRNRRVEVWVQDQ